MLKIWWKLTQFFFSMASSNEAVADDWDDENGRGPEKCMENVYFFIVTLSDDLGCWLNGC